MFLSAHYAGEDLVLKLNEGEPWKKVFGPVFMYVNSVVDKDAALSLWDDAKAQVQSIDIYYLRAFPFFTQTHIHQNVLRECLPLHHMYKQIAQILFPVFEGSP